MRIYDLRHSFPKLSAKRLFDEVGAAGYPGGHRRVLDYVRATRPGEPVEAPVRFETPVGRLGQVDFGTFTLRWGRHHALLIVPGYSRLLWLRFYPRQTMTVLLEALKSAFARFGGVPDASAAPISMPAHDAGARIQEDILMISPGCTSTEVTELPARCSTHSSSTRCPNSVCQR